MLWGGNTSVGRVQKDNSTYALKTIAKPVYTEMSWTEPGTYTWTCPAEVYRVRVALCAGGGGQIGAYPLSRAGKGRQVPNGGNSTFGDLITAFAGNSGYVTSETYKQGDHTRTRWVIRGMADGSPIVTSQPITSEVNGNGDYTQEYGWECSFEQKQVLYGFGSSGESYRPFGIAAHTLYLGTSGGYNVGYVDVVPYTTYQIIVGSAGTTLEYNMSANPNGSIGGNSCVLRPSKSGFVLIAFGGDI